MTSFSKLYSDFWINYNNARIVDAGADSQLMALYLQGNSHHNMLGVYYLPLLYISSDLGLSVKRVRAALAKLCKINYCKYDFKTQYVWVCNFALEQIGKVAIKDNRVKALQDIWLSLPSKLEFLKEIYQKYHSTFYLKKRSFDRASKICEIKNEEAITKEDISNTNTQPSAPLPVFTIPQKPTQDLSKDEVRNIFAESQLETLESPYKSFEIISNTDSDTKISFNASIDTDVFTKDSSICIRNESQDTTALLASPTEGSVDSLQRTFKAPSKVLQTFFEAHSEALRSNIEDISKNIEVIIQNTENINKKEEIEEELKEERNIQAMVPNTYIVAQARQHTNEKLPIQVPSFFESTQEIIPFAESSSGFPITLVIQDQMPKRTDNLENDADDIAAVFEHWKITMHHPRAKLCRKRKTLIRRALDDFSVEELCEAITGCSLTPHNIGKNEQGQRYDGLHIILKDEDQIERFIYNYNNPPKPYNKAYKRLEDNRCELIEWSKNKHNEYALENGHG